MALSPGDVRSGITYTDEDDFPQEGTCVVPVAGDVRINIPVDDTTGTYEGEVSLTEAALQQIDDKLVAQVTVLITNLLATNIETALTLKHALQHIHSAAIGILAGAGTTTITTRDKADTKNRNTVTVDAQGNRSAVTFNND